ncbi:MAG: bL35 family ribosomal protein [Patescibacteria group bacterium]
MPKQKSRKSVLRRFRITKSGKVLRRQAFRRHLKASKSKKRLKNLKRTIELKGHFAKRIKKSMGR